MKKLALLFLVVALMTSSVSAASFMKLGDIKGESREANHEEWIDIITFEQSMQREDNPIIGATRQRARATLNDMVFTKYLDKSSPKLQEAVATGKVFPMMEFEVTTPYGDRQSLPYYKYELENVVVTSYSISGDANERPTESFSLNYEKIKVTYMEQEDDGSFGDIVEWIFDLVRGR